MTDLSAKLDDLITAVRAQSAKIDELITAVKSQSAPIIYRWVDAETSIWHQNNQQLQGFQRLLVKSRSSRIACRYFLSRDGCGVKPIGRRRLRDVLQVADGHASKYR